MSLKGVTCVKGFVSLEDHRRCMVEEVGPPCLIPPTILEIMTKPNKERGAAGVKFSPSTLGSCHRQSVLKSGHDWYLDVEKTYRMTSGTVFHQGLENEPPPPGFLGVVRELRMNAPIKVRGQEERFHGKADEVLLVGVEKFQGWDESLGIEHVTPGYTKNRLHVKISDWKTKGDVGHDLTAPAPANVKQINMYAWLVQKYLPGWLNAYVDQQGVGLDDSYDHLSLADGVELPHIDEVVVVELALVYTDMSKPRTFTSKGFLYTRGKMLGAKGSDGRWHRYNPVRYDELALEPIHQFSTAYTESLIRKGIEEQIDSDIMLAPPLGEDDAKIMCRSCPVLNVCVMTGKREGYSMQWQEPYVARGEDDE